jgi:cytochrome c553
MNSIATQLSAQDIENLAAHFSSQAPAGSDAKSNQAECLACHQPLDKTSYLFTLKQLTEAAKK